tara:strand:+ start:7860 stop:8369 length:510 start_codon:yes stop_codon:yes gene_type:complete
MDFNQFNTRAHAEAGTPMQIVDPWTGEPMMDGDKPCRVIVRGTASKSVQAAMRAKAKAAMMSKKAKGDDADEEARVMEDVHMQLCEGAAPFIVGFENVKNGDKPATADDAMWFLDLTFPEMGVKEDGEGNAITDKDGNPQFEMKNNPFAKQIGEFAGKQANRLGNAQKG